MTAKLIFTLERGKVG